MKKFIAEIIQKTINQSGLSYYRVPLVGYAAASDPAFNDFQKFVGPHHLTPQDLMPDAKTVFAFFLPFQKQIIEHNRQGELASREWAEVYIATNHLINRIYADLERELRRAGVNFVSQSPTYEFDKELLVANWSHRHIAYVCGLGSFGRNNLLITPKGSGGRLGSGVMDTSLEPTGRVAESHHCLADTTGCRYCEKICPVGAIGPSGFKRQLCYRQCLTNDIYHAELE